MLNNIDISGAGKVAGGEYNNINVSGSGKITGDIKANKFIVAGSGIVLGDIEVNIIETSGAFKTLGNLNVIEKIQSSGSFKSEKNIVTNKLNIAGSLNCLGGISFDLLEFGGWLKCMENCEGRKICGEGKLRIDGLLSADEIDIRLLGESNINEIGGENIRITEGKRQKIRILCFSYNQKSELNCKIIEGDNIYLENTRAEVVRGNNITIGKNCVIERLEYSGELNINEKSVIKEKIVI